MVRRLTQEEFLQKCHAIHGDRYDYSQVTYQGGRIKVKVICHKHEEPHIFLVTPENHTNRKSGCPKCHNERAKVGEIYGTCWSSVKAGAKKRGLSLEVTQEEAWEIFQNQDGKCVYTGWPLTFTSNRVDQTASLDRIDSTGNYTKDNVQWVHRTVNFAKHSSDEDAFLKLCEAVVNHRLT